MSASGTFEARPPALAMSGVRGEAGFLYALTSRFDPKWKFQTSCKAALGR